MGIGMGSSMDEDWGCSNCSYNLEELRRVKEKYHQLEKLVNTLLDAQPKSHNFYKAIDKLHVRRLTVK